MTDWAALASELDHWRAARRIATFWWRDDDAVADTTALDRLLDCAGDAPIALAVIPDLAEPSLAIRLRSLHNVTVLQHGWRHTNHAASGTSEYPAERDAAQVAAEFEMGRIRLQRLFPDHALPVFAPPWHGFDDRFITELQPNGLRGLSRKGARPFGSMGDLRQNNVHCIPILWSEPPGFGPDEQYLQALSTHLRDRRLGHVDPEEATGLLTHHLVQNAESYRFMDRLSQLIAIHPAAGWADARILFA